MLHNNTTTNNNITLIGVYAFMRLYESAIMVESQLNKVEKKTMLNNVRKWKI